jgi:hypothetical protein
MIRFDIIAGRAGQRYYLSRFSKLYMHVALLVEVESRDEPKLGQDEPARRRLAKTELLDQSVSPLVKTKETMRFGARI